MNFLIQLIKNYSERYPDEKVAITMLSFIEDEKNHFSRSNHHGHFTGSAWILNPDKSKILMTYHKKIGKWLQLGGHADGEKDLLKVSQREAIEESGMNNFVTLSNEIFDMDINVLVERAELVKNNTDFHTLVSDSMADRIFNFKIYSF